MPQKLTSRGVAHVLKPLVRILVTASILALILRSVDTRQLLAVLSQARPDLLALALLLQFGSTAISAYRWQLIMHNLDFGQPFGFYLRSYLKGMFLNQGLPTSIGGDTLRVLDVASRGFRKRDALYGVGLDRIVGLGALISLTFFAYLGNPDLLPPQVYRPIFLLIAFGLIGLLSLSFLRHVAWLKHHTKLRLLWIMSARFHQAFSAHRPSLIVLSLVIPLLAMLSFFSLGWALGLRYDIMTYFAIVPPAIVLTVIPISVAGWGVREGALVSLFSLVGADKSAVLMMSLLYGLTLVIVGLPGLAVYLRGLQGQRLPGHG